VLHEGNVDAQNLVIPGAIPLK